jgi:hypothetical protein
VGLSRRELMGLGAAFVATSAMPLVGAQNKDQLLSATAKDFLSHLGSVFTVNGDSMRPSWLALTLVRDSSSPSLRANLPKIETFTLHFDGTGEPLSQGTWELQHEVLGRISLFLVPGDLSRYTAVISHLLGPLPAGYATPRRASGSKIAENRPAARPQNRTA